MKPLTLIIMDGFGLNPDTYGNAIKAANTPNLDYYFSNYPFTTSALPEWTWAADGRWAARVGHTNIGAGRWCIRTTQE